MLNLQLLFRWKRRRALRRLTSFNASRKQRMWMSLLILFGLGLLHTAGMIGFEGLSAADAWWLTVTSMTTVGYGDISASTLEGRLTTTVLIYGFGITALANIAAEFIEYREWVRDLKRTGHWDWKMKNHILIINTPNDNTETYLSRLLRQIRTSPETQELPVNIISSKFPDGLPATLKEDAVAHTHGISEDNDTLIMAGVADAKYIIVLARDSNASQSDSMTLDVLMRIDELTQANDHKPFILAEAVDDRNRDRLNRFGAGAVIRPMRAYPELVVRSFLNPGTDVIMENIFQTEGDHFHRYDIRINAASWASLSTAVINNNLGIAIGYVSDEGQVISNPDAHQPVSGKALICMVNDRQLCDNASLEAITRLAP